MADVKEVLNEDVKEVLNEDEPPVDEDGELGGDPAGGEPDPEMMSKLMGAMGQGGGEGGGGGMDMAALQAMLGGMGGMGGIGGMGGGMPGGPPAEMQQQAQRNQAEAAAKNDGEKDAGTYKWEQTSSGGDSEVIVRFPLSAPATKKDVKVVFKAKELKVTVAGVELLNAKTYGTTYSDDCTWCLVEKGAELQVMLALAEDTKWHSLVLEE